MSGKKVLGARFFKSEGSHGQKGLTMRGIQNKSKRPSPREFWYMLSA